MSIDEIIAYIESLGGVLTLKPQPGDGTPELAWGDAFFYYAPDGVVPKTQPFATIVTKDYPDDRTSRLDREGVFRVNIAAGSAAFREWTGREPKDAAGDADPSAVDVVLPHPVYGRQSWLCVVDPGPRTDEPVRELLRAAHHAARDRFERRAERADG